MSALISREDAATFLTCTNTVIYRSGWWGIRCAPHIAMRIKRLFPRVAQDRAGVIQIKDTPEVARDIEWLIGRHPLALYDDETTHRLKERADEHRATEEAVTSILAGRTYSDHWREPALPARPYQMVAADLAHRTGRLLIGDELGLGKTFTSLLMLRDPETLPALVVCPTHLPRQWAAQIAKFMPWLTVHIAKTRTPKKSDADVLIVPYSKIVGWRDYLAGTVRAVIFDEVQELRRTGSDKYQACAHVADGALWRVGLSATPVYNYGGEVHSIFDVLSPDTLGTRAEFLREWGASDYNGKLKVKDPAALGTYLRDAGLLLRRTRKGVGRELPAEPVKIEHEVSSDPKVLEQVLGDVSAMAALVLDRTANQQDRWKAAGEMDWRLRQATGVAKAPYVAEFVRLLLESEDKIVLAGWHRSVYDLWAEALAEFDPVFYTGTESPNQKAAAVEAFVNGKSRVFVISLRSGSGLDGLQEAASTVVFGELDWSPAMHDQLIGRVARDGQDNQVVAYYLVSRDGSDPVLADVLEIKRQQGEPIRDPSLPVLATTDKSANRTRLLAQSVLNHARKAHR